MSRPAALAVLRAPMAAVCGNSASAAMIARVLGFGVCAAATSKNPLVKLTAGSMVPVGSIEKYLGYSNSLLTSIPNSEKNVILCWMTIGIAGASKLVP